MQNVCEQQLMTNCMRAEACVIIIRAVVNTLFFGGIVCMHWCIAMSEQASKYNVSAFMLPVVLLLPQYLLLFGYRGTRGIALSANATFKRCAHAALLMIVIIVIIIHSFMQLLLLPMDASSVGPPHPIISLPVASCEINATAGVYFIGVVWLLLRVLGRWAIYATRPAAESRIELEYRCS